MEKRDLEVGNVVQINPEHDERFAACFMVVTEPKSWGAQGYIQVPGKQGQAFYRCDFENMEYVGRAEFVLESHAAKTDLTTPQT